MKWLKDGEKVSKYVCNLEKRNFEDKSMTLEKEDGEIISEQKKILEEVETFYITL